LYKQISKDLHVQDGVVSNQDTLEVAGEPRTGIRDHIFNILTRTALKGS